MTVTIVARPYSAAAHRTIQAGRRPRLPCTQTATAHHSAQATCRLGIAANWLLMSLIGPCS